MAGLLKYNSSGNAVKRLARLLNKESKLSPGLKGTGWFGPTTKRAVIAFQVQKGLQRDGIVGPYTWAALGVPYEGPKLTISVQDTSDRRMNAIYTFLGQPSVKTIEGVTDFVNTVMNAAKEGARVIARVGAKETGGIDSIYRLKIFGHGFPGGQRVGGGESINYANVETHRLTLMKLNPYFRKDAIVTLCGCKVARGTDGDKLLKGLFKIWHVLVQAGVELQYAGRTGMEGETKRCWLAGCSRFEATSWNPPDQDDDALY